jgi:aminoglycoside 6'-N-acetyltransferase I
VADDITIRSAVPADSGVLDVLRLALYPETREGELAEELRRFFAGDLHMPLEILIAEGADGTAAGFVELSIRAYAEGCLTDRVGYLEGWYVIPAARRRGVGRALVQAAEHWAQARGCTEFASDALIDNETSAAAHRALGFEEVERITCFRKSLAP